MQNRIMISPFDQDLIVVNGSGFAGISVSNVRFNGYYQTAGNNLDSFKFTRYFTKGGLYKARFMYNKNTDAGKVNIGTDTNGATNIANQIDTYNGSSTFMNIFENLVEISRGWHDIFIQANSKNASSSAYEIRFQMLEIDLVYEYPVYKDDQPTVQMPRRAFQRPSLQFAALAADYTTTTTANDVSTGTGVTVASPHTDRIKVKIAAIVANSLINDGVTLKVYRSTSSIPAQGSASGGSDTVVYSTTVTEVVAAEQVGIPAEFVDSSLTPGVTYYYYITIKAVTAGTAKIQGGTNQTTILAEPV